MSWNQRDRLFALGVVAQPVAGTFVLPGVANLIGCSSPNNGDDVVSAPDPTQTGTIWDAPRIFMGLSGTGGGTIPLRGPGGGAPPAANAWPFGILMQACGFTEIRRAAAQVATAVGVGSTTTQIVLNASESAVDDFLLGQPVQNAAIGTGFRQTSLIQDYVGSTKAALLAETLGGVPAGTYVLPAGLFYILGTMGVAPPLFSMSVWRDKKRYDYRDCVITNWSLDVPVGNEQNQSFPSLDFSVKGVPIAPSDDVTPALPQALINIPVPPARAGKFFLDKIKLGHVGVKTNIQLQTGAAPNQNQDPGQDGYDVLSGSRSVDLTLNQMSVSDFDLDARVRAQTQVGMLSTWGQSSGNYMGLMIPALFLDPQKPGSSNGYVTVGGNAIPAQLDKGIALSFWY